MRIPAPIALVVLCALAVGCAESSEADNDDDGTVREYINARSPADGEVPPFSGAVRVGETLYLSGTIGRKPDGSIPETAEEEARLVLDNVKSTLEAAGMTMDDLVSVQVLCSDVSHYGAFNSVYRTYFEGEFPARAFIGSGPLLFGARFEVQSIAVQR